MLNVIYMRKEAIAFGVFTRSSLIKYSMFRKLNRY